MEPSRPRGSPPDPPHVGSFLSGRCDRTPSRPSPGLWPACGCQRKEGRQWWPSVSAARGRAPSPPRPHAGDFSSTGERASNSQAGRHPTTRPLRLVPAPLPRGPSLSHRPSRDSVQWLAACWPLPSAGNLSGSLPSLKTLPRPALRTPAPHGHRSAPTARPPATASELRLPARRSRVTFHGRPCFQLFDVKSTFRSRCCPETPPPWRWCPSAQFVTQ